MGECEMKDERDLGEYEVEEVVDLLKYLEFVPLLLLWPLFQRCMLKCPLAA